jgi:hypothetical protein
MLIEDANFCAAEQQLENKLIFRLSGSRLVSLVAVHFSYSTISAPCAMNNITN